MFYSVDEIVHLFTRILLLNENWDTYGARAPSPVLVSKAITFLSQLSVPSNTVLPRVMALPSGGVYIEWESEALEVAFYFEHGKEGPETNVYARRGDDEREGALTDHQNFAYEVMKDIIVTASGGA